MSKRAAKEVVQDDKANKRQKRLTYEQRQRVSLLCYWSFSSSATAQL